MFNTLKVWDVVTAFVKKDGFNPMNLRCELAPGNQIPERVKRIGLKFDILRVNRGTVATCRPFSEQRTFCLSVVKRGEIPPCAKFTLLRPSIGVKCFEVCQMSRLNCTPI